MQASFNELLKSSLENSDSDDDNIPDDDELKKIEKANKNEDLLDFHPEIKQINYKELQTLCKITKDKLGNIIDPLHKTIPILTVLFTISMVARSLSGWFRRLLICLAFTLS